MSQDSVGRLSTIFEVDSSEDGERSNWRHCAERWASRSQESMRQLSQAFKLNGACREPRDAVFGLELTRIRSMCDGHTSRVSGHGVDGDGVPWQGVARFFP